MLGAIASHYVASGGGGTGYAAEVLADSPLAYWRLGEASGTVMGDSSGNGRTGTYTDGPTLGAASLLTSDADTCVDFNGSPYSLVSHGTWMDAASFTVEALIKPDVVTGTRTIMARHGSTWTFRLDGGNRLAFYLWVGGGNLISALESSGSFVAGTTAHVAATFENGVGAKIYKNGTLVGSTAETRAVDTTTAQLRIAASAFGEHFDGKIDEAAFYGSALSSTRIAAHVAAA